MSSSFGQCGHVAMMAFHSCVLCFNVWRFVMHLDSKSSGAAEALSIVSSLGAVLQLAVSFTKGRFSILNRFSASVSSVNIDPCLGHLTTDMAGRIMELCGCSYLPELLAFTSFGLRISLMKLLFFESCSRSIVSALTFAAVVLSVAERDFKLER